MGRDQIIETIRNVLEEHGIREAYLFGSFARKERQYRDIDVAIKPPRGKFSLLDLVRIENLLYEKTGKKIELVTLRSIHRRLMPHIKNDLMKVL